MEHPFKVAQLVECVGTGDELEGRKGKIIKWQPNSRQWFVEFDGLKIKLKSEKSRALFVQSNGHPCKRQRTETAAASRPDAATMKDSQSSELSYTPRTL